MGLLLSLIIEGQAMVEFDDEIEGGHGRAGGSSSSKEAHTRISSSCAIIPLVVSSDSVMSNLLVSFTITASEQIGSVKTFEESASLERQHDDEDGHWSCSFATTVVESNERRESVQEETRLTGSMMSSVEEDVGRDDRGLLFEVEGSGDQRPESLSSLLELLDSLEELLELE